MLHKLYSLTRRLFTGTAAPIVSSRKLRSRIPFRPWLEIMEERNAPAVVNFDSLNALGVPGGVGGTTLTNYLAGYGVTISNVAPGAASMVVMDYHNLYGGTAAVPPSLPNLFTEVGSNDPTSFTLNFAQPQNSFGFTRSSLVVATSSGVTHPQWNAYAFSGPNGTGTQLATVGEGLIASYSNVPAATFTLTGPGIQSVRFDSVNYHFAAFSAVLLDNLVLSSAPTVNVTDAGGGFTNTQYAASATAVLGSTDVSSAGTFTYAYYVGSTPSGGSTATPPTNVGTYTVVATFNSATYGTLASAPVTFTITPATPTLNVTDGGTYNGSAFPASGTATGPTGTVAGTFTYTYYLGTSAAGTGSATAPSAVGTYTVVASFANSNANYTNAQTSLTFTISVPYSLAQAVGAYNGSYTGSAGSYGSVSGGVNFSIDSSGNVTVTNPGSGSGTVTSGGSLSMSGAGSITVGTYPVNVTYSYTGAVGTSSAGTNASGTWTATWTQSGGGTATGTWSAALNGPTIVIPSGTFDGAANPAAAVATVPTGVSITNATWSNASGGTVTITATNTFSAGQYVYITGVTPFVYNGSFQVLTASTSQFTYALPLPISPAAYVSGGTGYLQVNGSFGYIYYVGSTASGAGSTTAPTNPGTYTVVASFTSSDPSYGNAQTTAIYTIQPSVGSYAGSYTGSAGSYGSVSGGVNFTIDSGGHITVTNPGSGTGSISQSGALAITGSGAIMAGPYPVNVNYTYTGTVVTSSSGATTASGTWTASFTGGTANGIWSASLTATPGAIAPSGVIHATTAGYDMPTFSWVPVLNTTSYTLIVADTTTGQVALNIAGLQGTSFTPSASQALMPGHSFTWYVIAYSGPTTYTYSSQTFSLDGLPLPTALTVDGVPLPSAFPIPAGLNYDEPTFSWTPSAAVNHYFLVVVDNTTGMAPIAVNNITGSSYLASIAQSLTPGHSFTVYVVAYSNNGQGYAIASQTFSLAALGPPTFISPTSGQILTGGPGYDSPNFQWSPVLGANHYYLYVYDNTTSQAVIINNYVAGTSFQANRVLTPGDSYTAYVFPVSTNGQLGPYATQSFSLAPLSKPTINAPTGPIIAMPIFSWTASPGADHYYLVVVDTTTGTAPVAVPNVAGTVYVTTIAQALTLGHSFTIYVFPVSINGQLGPYATLPFSLPALTAPTSLTPSGPQNASSGYDKPTFTWNSVPYADHYYLAVVDTTTGLMQFAIPNVSGTTAPYPATAQALTPGHSFTTYVWAVSINSQAYSSPATKTFSLAGLAAPTSLTPNTTIGAGAGYDKPTFSWTASPGADHYYLVVLDSTTGLTQFVVPNVSGTTTPYPATAPALTPGHSFTTYVYAFSTNNQAYSAPATQTFALAALAAPTGLNPSTSATTIPSPTSFSWTTVTGADHYYIYVLDDNTGLAAINTTSGSSPYAYVGPALFSTHKYTWWVAAVSTNGVSWVWSASQDFTIS